MTLKLDDHDDVTAQARRYWTHITRIMHNRVELLMGDETTKAMFEG